MSNLHNVPDDRRCNAKTRAGTPCKTWAEHGRTRCKFHGGKRRRGMAAPRYRHGFSSRDLTCRVLWDAALRGDPIARPFVEQLAAEEAARAGGDTALPKTSQNPGCRGSSPGGVRYRTLMNRGTPHAIPAGLIGTLMVAGNLMVDGNALDSARSGHRRTKPRPQDRPGARDPVQYRIMHAVQKRRATVAPALPGGSLAMIAHPGRDRSIP